MIGALFADVEIGVGAAVLSVGTRSASRVTYGRHPRNFERSFPETQEKF
jgi:hypothetical protein